MSKNKSIPVFELSLAEQAELLRPAIERVQKENINSGLYNSYTEVDNGMSGHFVRIYTDRKEVVQIDDLTENTEVAELFTDDGFLFNRLCRVIARNEAISADILSGYLSLRLLRSSQ